MQTDKPKKVGNALFQNRNFRWLMSGGVVSMLGDQFTLIALPWLVLKMTGDSFILGGVLAIMSLPRAIFILVGGALVDRYSPKRVLMLTKLINMCLLGALAALVWSGTLQLWMVYGFALAIGLNTAFSMPAGTSILPFTLPPESLQAANGALMSLRQLTVLVGPAMAGGLIMLFGDSVQTSHGNAHGLGLAFGFDAFSFAFSAWTLTQVRLAAKPNIGDRQPVMHAIAEALKMFWNDHALRTLCLYFAAIAFFVGGPIQVALPVLANTQLAGGAASLGLLLAGHGAGVLAGMAFSGLRPNWRLGTLGSTVLMIDALSGLVFIPFGYIHALWQGIALLAPLGALGGFVQVAIFTWMQKRVPAEMLGRAMSIFMFIFMGLAPFAAAAAGLALRVMPPSTLFTCSGVSLLVIVLIGVVLTPIREIRDWREPATANS